MKLHILNDLHVEFDTFAPPETDADVVVLAGDIHVGTKGISWASTVFPDKPVLYILGNHEYYGKAYPKHVDDLKALAKGTNIHILENDSLTIDNYTFLGCTLWTDFKLLGDPRIAGFQATQVMNDYRKIRLSPQYRKLRSIDTVVIHNRSLAWLHQEIEPLKARSAKTIIITHHAPSKNSLPDDRQEEIFSAAYASSLDDFVAASGASLWVHGHIHHQQDYALGQTRVVSNPRGYPDERNAQFLPNLVVEI
jgi:predicted phosphodiesterase